MFNPNNWLWKNVARIGDLIGLSVCWLLCSLPLFTAGAAAAALYDAVAHCVRGEESGTFGRYFRAFRDNFIPSLPVTLLFLAAEGLIWWAYTVAYLMAEAGDPIAVILLYADLLLFCVPLAVWLMAVTTLSRFTFRGLALVLTALKLTFRHLPTAVLITIVVLAAGFVVRLLILPAVILPGVAAVVVSLPLERVFHQYQTQETKAPEDR